MNSVWTAWATLVPTIREISAAYDCQDNESQQGCLARLLAHQGDCRARSGLQAGRGPQDPRRRTPIDFPQEGAGYGATTAPNGLNVRKNPCEQTLDDGHNFAPRLACGSHDPLVDRHQRGGRLCVGEGRILSKLWRAPGACGTRGCRHSAVRVAFVGGGWARVSCRLPEWHAPRNPKEER